MNISSRNHLSQGKQVSPGGEVRERRVFEWKINIDIPTDRKTSVDVVKTVSGLISFEYFYGSLASETVIRAMTTAIFKGLERSSYYCDHSVPLPDTVRVTVGDVVKVKTKMPIIPENLGKTISIDRTFSIRSKGVITPRIHYTAELTSTILHPSDYYRPGIDSMMELESYGKGRTKCNLIMDKLIRYGFPDSYFNYERLISEIDLGLKFTVSNADDTGDLGEWTTPLQSSVGEKPHRVEKEKELVFIRGKKQK
ncbi:matrix protein [Nephotettix cincticeps negative-stranded RNA virus 1]|nr:matrix protein [Nephotettix cincticeps negative-stranded RNA virus 1]UHK03289.1 MAG: hypothetical protein FNCRV1_gp3 [Hangzhou nephotettix cincticeps rhabdovirus 1]